ncbi:MAG: glycosyl hydrolase-related protein, partial [Kiritimatiellae bacterium]|nr:hypothetical protein [Verrucomicrobiota bacterium]MCG2660919.1 glycosyl hydrolase-related protein [Kiritimatiellia bacterium]
GSNVVVSVLKSGAKGYAVLRVYEATGQPARKAKIKFFARVTAAEEVNLMEDAVRKLKPRNNTVPLDLCPFEIKTIKLRIPPLRCPHPYGKI